MSVMLLVLGILLTGAGVVMVGFGAPTSESSVGQTLIIAGVTALVGGPLMIGLAAALSRLAAIAEALKGKPGADAKPTTTKQRADIAASEPRPEPRLPEPRLPELRQADPPTASSINVSASAIERLCSTTPRPDQVVAHPEDVPLSPGGTHPPEPLPEPRLESPRSSAPIEAFREPRLDFLFRARPQPPRPPESL
jgi:hypothetical protein